MAGTPADMTVAPYKDSSMTNDHTYYGRGCKNGWGTDGDGGSQTPCADSDAGGRYVTTADGETQRNGTYYHFQAVTTGTGGTMSTNNTNSSDTFCPLGWQLPYDGTGGDYYDKSKSWRYLFTTYNIGFNEGTIADATKVKSYPLSYVYPGYYFWFTGRLYGQTVMGRYWSTSIAGATTAHSLITWISTVRLAEGAGKTSGFTVRCTIGTSNLKAPHGIRVRL